MPQRKRLPDRACRVIAVIAAQAGVRAGICMMPVPALMRLVRASTQATGVTASVPYASPAHTASKPRRSASQTRPMSMPLPGDSFKVAASFMRGAPRRRGDALDRAQPVVEGAVERLDQDMADPGGGVGVE